MSSDFKLNVGRTQLGLGVVAGVAAYVVGFLVSFLPGPIANPRAYQPRDVVNATLNESEVDPGRQGAVGATDPEFPLTETIDSFNSAAGVFYNAHFVDIIAGLPGQPALSRRENVLLNEVTNDTVSTGMFGGGEIELLLVGVPVPPVVFFLVPAVLLALGGVLINERAGETASTPETAVVSGSAVVLGYLPLAAVVASIVRFRELRIISGGIDLLGAILIAGIVYPVALGGLGGYVWFVARGTSGEDVEASAADTGNATHHPRETPSGDAGPTDGRGSEETSARTTTVAMTDELAFAPETVTVTPGGVVRWENGANITVTVTAYGETIPRSVGYFASGGFDSEDAAREAYPKGGIASGESYEHVFETPGTYEYFCVPQEGAGMTGTVEVREE
jgi:plastocyanin